MALLAASYLLGSFPQVYLLGRLRGVDLRREADLHIALWRQVSPVLSFIGVLGDLAKGAIPILVARGLEMDPWVVALAGLLAVVGQMWPAYLFASGGRGNTTGLAMALTLAPSTFLIGLIPIGLGAIIRTLPRFIKARQFASGPPSRSLPLGIILGFALLPAAAWWQAEAGDIVLAYAGLFLAIVVRRLSVGLSADFKGANSKIALFWNRFLYDRSFL